MRVFYENLSSSLHLILRDFSTSLAFVVVIALGVGSATAVISIYRAVLGERLPVARPENIILFGWTAIPQLAMSLRQGVYDYPDPSMSMESQRGRSFPYATYDTFVTDLPKSIEAIWAFAPISKSWTGDTKVNILAEREPMLASGELVSGNYFGGLGLRPRLGRVINTADVQAKAAVAVISYQFWLDAFGGNESIIGRSISFGNDRFSIIGVLEENFTGLVQGAPVDFWVPFSERAGLTFWGQSIEKLSDVGWWGVIIMARVRPNVLIRPLQSSLQALFEQSLKTSDSSVTHSADIQPGHPLPQVTVDQLPRLELRPASGGIMLVGDRLRQAVSVAVGFAIYVFLSGWIIGFFMLRDRYYTRLWKSAVSVTDPISWLRLSSQVFRESAWLCVAGSICGIIVGFLSCRLTFRILSVPLALYGLVVPREVHHTAAVLLVAGTAAMALVVPLEISTFHLLRAPDTVSALKRALIGHELRKQLLSGFALVLHIAVTIILLICMISATITFRHLSARPLGFNPRGLLVADVHSGYGNAVTPTLVAKYVGIQNRLNNLPGVNGVASSILAPLSERGAMLAIATRRTDNQGDKSPIVVKANLVGPQFIKIMGMSLLCGHDFDERDDRDNKKVAVVNEAFAEQFFDNSCPLGNVVRVVGRNDVDNFTVMGVIRNAAYETLFESPATAPPVIYLSYIQFLPYGFDEMFFEVRTDASESRLRKAIAQVTREIDPTFAVGQISSEIEVMSLSIAPQYAMSRLSALAGGFSLALVAFGFARFSRHTLSNRVRELYLGLVLTDTSWQVSCRVLGYGILAMVLGVPIGVSVGLDVLQYITNNFYELERPNNLLIAIVAVVSILAALCAGTATAVRTGDRDTARTPWRA